MSGEGSRPRRILTVCKGGHCRAPLAAAVLARHGGSAVQTRAAAVRDNPDGDRLYAVQREQARRRAEREAAEREAQRPVCTRCGAKFTDDRWQSIRQSTWRSEGHDLCGPCEQEAAGRAEADRVARRQAEEAAAREAAEAEAKKNRGLFKRRR
ncbi:hypothetical protein OG978_46395 (plasmid) [Streptomyces sp. NBC_01591]|uniref:hypothetical protein n=1 Tax=Streptomyces sp. NBC_01591 TaxID=2975888 RepID=UPI002DD8BA85|nr:hypothetical protein [Streptomyces sp. NBC_01591]WSD74456.1 hypothetical protein OG978_46395 [Streptomyces sp. NBC_01591]